MKQYRYVGVLSLFVILSLILSPVYVQADSVLDALGGEERVISGLKEALKVGTTSAVELVSALDGFYKNEAIKILLPEKRQKSQGWCR